MSENKNRSILVSLGLFTVCTFAYLKQKRLPPNLSSTSSRAFSSDSKTQIRSVIATEFGAPSVLKLSSKPIPLPSRSQVQIEVKAAGVNPSDTYQRLGPQGLF